MDIWQTDNQVGNPDVLYMSELSWHFGRNLEPLEVKPKKQKEVKPNMELMPHQVKAVEELHNGAILKGGMGSGKTITSLWYFWEKVCEGVVGQVGSPKKPMDLYVITTAKKRDSLDWEEQAVKLGIASAREHSPFGTKMTVDSWNNIDKYKDVENAYFIFDEQRLVGAGAWSKAFIHIAKANEWIVLTATPGDTWLDYIPVFVANGFYRNRTEFKREHVVYNTYSKFPKVERYTNVGKLVRAKHEVLVEMPFERHTTWNTIDVEVDYDQHLYERVVKDRWHVYENRPLRDVAEMFAVMRKVVNSDVSRLEAISGLLQKHPRLIVFYNFDYELEALRSLADGATGQTLSSSSSNRMDFYSSSSTQMRDCAPMERWDLSDRRNPVFLGMASTEREFQKPGMLSSKHGSLASDSGSHTAYRSSTSPQNSSSQTRRLSTCEDTSKKATSSAHAGDLTEMSNRLSDLEVANLMAGLPLDTPAHQTSAPLETATDRTQAAPIVLAEWNGHKHEPVPTDERWVYLVQYVAGAEAWDCVETDTVAFYSQTYSYKNFHQAHGRIDRLNTPFKILNYYVLKSRAPIDQMIGKSLASKKNFNESEHRHKV